MELRECTLNELEPDFRRSLEQHLPNDDQVGICYQAPFSGHLLVVVVTTRRIVQVFKTKYFLERVRYQTNAMQLEDIRNISEGEYAGDLFTPREFYIKLIGNTSGLDLRFPRKDELYYRIMKLLRDAIDNARK